jgi:hypothetical protein
MTLRDVHLDSDLVTDLLGHPALTPSLHSHNIRLRQTPHTTSVQLVLLRRSLESAASTLAPSGHGSGGRPKELARFGAGLYPVSAVKLTVPADGSCPKGRFVASGVDVRYLDLDRAGVFMTGMSAVVDGAPSWVA